MPPSRFQNAFFAQLPQSSALRAMFDLMPDVYFFVKDTGSRMVAASPMILQRLGFKSEAEFIGKTDDEVFPQRLANSYRADDLKVFRTGKPLEDRLEIWVGEAGQLDWCVTTKTPLTGRNGKVVGLMGVTRRDPWRAVLQPSAPAAEALAYLKLHCGRTVSTAELARAAKVSERTLHRAIRADFGISPYELALRLRVQQAAEKLLQTSESIPQIALAHGFCDQSAFTHQFKKRMGTTPKQFRLKHSRISRTG
jgi:AraC-like DNA-binding protein